jgi:competence protein ComEC
MTAALIALAWVLGLVAVAHTGAGANASLAAAGLFAAVTFAVRPRPETLLVAAAGAALIFAAGWRYEETSPREPPSSISRLNEGGGARFRAVVDDEPEERPNSRLYRLRAVEAYENGRWRERTGGVLMRTSPYTDYEYGQLLELRGELETPPSFEGFDYRDYLLRRGVVSLIGYPRVRVLEDGQGSPLKAALIGLRGRLSDSLADALPEPEASLAAGILFGARKGLPQDVKEDMNTTGTSHLVAVSGQNVTMLAGFVIAGLAWLTGRRRACWIALGAIVAYAALVGGQPSVIRAAIMGSLYVGSVIAGRQNTGFVALLIAAAAMTALHPQIVHDVSFQLSFAATLGLILAAHPLAELLSLLTVRWPALHEFPGTKAVRETAAMTLAAIAFTMPISAVNFGQVSLSAPAANLFAVPAFVAVAVTAGAAAAGGLLLPFDASFLGWLAWPAAAYMIGVVRLFASLPGASVQLSGVHTVHAAVFYVVLFAAVYRLNRLRLPLIEAPRRAPEAPRPLLVPAGGLGLLMLLAGALVWGVASAPAEGRLTVTFMNVGQGDAVLIEGPEGHRVLVDGGPTGDAITAALGRRLPFYGRRIDAVVLTHPQADHLGGLPAVLQRYEVGAVLTSDAEADTALYRRWQEALDKGGVPVLEVHRGHRIDLGNGAAVTVMSPPRRAAPPADPNDASVVLQVSMGRFALLLTGDIGEVTERELLRRGTDVRTTVLKAGHHGSRSSTSEAFLRRATPAVGVISVGADNPFGHPAPETLGRLEGGQVYRTDVHGDITVTTDGERLWVRTQRAGE